MYLAPAGRMFIAGRHANILKPQRGDMFIAGRHVPFVSITNYTEGGKGEGESPLVYLAPAGRHVYSWATCKYLKAPEGRHVRFV